MVHPPHLQLLIAHLTKFTLKTSLVKTPLPYPYVQENREYSHKISISSILFEIDYVIHLQWAGLIILTEDKRFSHWSDYS